MPMPSGLVPIKTPEGHAELRLRLRGLSQRHRTVLLLVDGRRSAAQVMHMAAAAGVPASCFDELLALGLIAPPLSERAEPAFAPDSGPQHVELPLTGDDSLLPAARSLLPESEQGELGGPEFPEPEAPELVDPAFEEARETLMRALRSEAPVSGSLTLLKLKRARSRADLADLLDEVEQRIRKPRRQIIAGQILRQVRHLLSLPPAVS